MYNEVTIINERIILSIHWEQIIRFNGFLKFSQRKTKNKKMSEENFWFFKNTQEWVQFLKFRHTLQDSRYLGVS
jgi:predicted acetyltransferase